ncbi:MAG: SusC/RagA family TonB-linked outer membrane protein [Prevotella sp.]|nr:SusC/RagA family TonB-linked outer membrane protein [Prevotella sp.]
MMQEKHQKRFISSLLLLTLLLLPISGRAAMPADTKMSIDVKSVPVEQVLNEIHRKAKIDFFYDANLAKEWPKITLRATNKTAEEIIGQVASLINCTYTVNGNIVTISQKKLSGRERTVRGYVRDADGETLVGVPVCIGETRVCTVTDADGFYTFKIPVEATTLKFSYVGLSNEYVLIPQGNSDVTRDVVMRGDTRLNEVVVNGYYSQAKNSFTGAAKTYDKEQLLAGSNQNILTALQNVDPSFVKIENNAMGSNPNSVPDFQIRGSGSITGMSDTYKGNPNMPIFIVDGFETSAEKVFDMDPYRVETITLLKDAAATAVYGSRAANGVVVITTTMPKTGKMELSYNADLTFYVPDLSAYNLCTPEQKLELERIAGIYDVSTRSYYNQDKVSDQIRMDMSYNWRLKNVREGVNTDWLAQPLDQVATGHKHSIRLDGGSENFRYAMDLNYNNTPGVMKQSGRERMGLGLELQYIYKNITFRDQLTYSNVTSKNSPYGAFSSYATLNPYLRFKNDDGSYIYQVDIDDRYHPLSYRDPVYNPLFNTTLNTIDKSGYNDLTNLFGIDWHILEGLRLKGTFSFTVQNTSTDIFKPGQHTDFATYTGDNFDRRGSYTASRGDVFDYDGSLVLSYFKEMGVHVLNANLGWNIQQQKSKEFTVVAEGFPNDNLDYISFGSQYELNGSPSGDEYTSRLVGFLGNLNYSYDERYMIDLSFREDASSRFGADSRWAPFWSAGLGWNIHKEHFMKDAKWLSELKLRATYGLTGSQEYDPYQAITTYQYLTGQRYHYGVGAKLLAMGNEELTWQRTNEKNFGVDLALFNNRFELSYDYYIKTSKDVLTAVTLPPSLGFTTYMANLGEVENKGWELSARAVLLKDNAHQLHWSVFGSMIHNKNKLLKISNSLRAYNDVQDQATEGHPMTSTENADPGKSVPTVRFIEGESINSIWVNESLGIDPLTGRELFRAKDGSIVSDWSAKNYVIGGCTDPDVEGTFGTLFSWRGLQLSATFRYRMGGQLYNQTLVDKVQDIDPRYNADARALTARWQKPGDVVRFAAFTRDTNGVNQESVTRPTSRFVEDYNYLELATLNLSYEFENNKLLKYGIKRMKLLFYMNDVFHTSTVKVERGTSYPYARNFSLGLQVRF